MAPRWQLVPPDEFNTGPRIHEPIHLVQSKTQSVKQPIYSHYVMYYVCIIRQEEEGFCDMAKNYIQKLWK